MLELDAFELLGTAFSVILVLFGDGLALHCALKDHVALELRETQHDVSDEPPGRRVIDDAHVKHVNDNALVAETFEKLNALNETASNAIQLRNDERVARLNDLQELVELRTRVFRAAEHIRENFDSPRVA